MTFLSAFTLSFLGRCLLVWAQRAFLQVSDSSGDDASFRYLSQNQKNGHPFNSSNWSRLLLTALFSLVDGSVPGLAVEPEGYVRMWKAAQKAEVKRDSTRLLSLMSPQAFRAMLALVHSSAHLTMGGF